MDSPEKGSADSISARVVAAMSRLGPPGVQALLKLGERPDQTGADALCWLRTRCADDPIRLLPVALLALKQDRPWQRTLEATMAVAKMGTEGKPAAGLLRRQLGSAEPALRSSSLSALAGVGADDDDTLHAILELRESGTPKDRVLAAFALIRLRHRVQENIDLLVNAMANRQQDLTRDLAAICLSAPEAFRATHLNDVRDSLPALGEITRQEVKKRLRRVGVEL